MLMIRPKDSLKFSHEVCACACACVCVASQPSGKLLAWPIYSWQSGICNWKVPRRFESQIHPVAVVFTMSQTLYQPAITSLNPPL